LLHEWRLEQRNYEFFTTAAFSTQQLALSPRNSLVLNRYYRQPGCSRRFKWPSGRCTNEQETK
jgi:hypothetical protein